ncbi:hypothetical protein [Sphingomonas abietis]|uniref:DUF11 domain-containing protein n=1 Tax=Sphingomonas abietis TaxID=3012344 RepID=A0ABY7NUL9_9SPHN|nr:hypothetical protein [Sphingomonas abietis]WBO23151.1 hypothetical protein PBT88_03145 [Sphingomonas abietis]
MSDFRKIFRRASLGLGLATAAVPVTTALSAPVSNTASIHYTINGLDRTVSSNTVSTEDVIAKRPTTLSFRQLPDGYKLHDMKCDTSPTIMFTPSPVNVAELAASAPLESFDVFNPEIIVIDSQGGNHDPLVRETVTITADFDGHSHPVPLLETGPDTGVFAGAFPGIGSPVDDALKACDPSGELSRNGTVKISFTEDEYSYGSTATLLIDPTGYTFDSRTGTVIDGATVSIVNDATGQPAAVIGEDGKSVYPSTVISGQTATDSSGHVYPASPGKYRFPLLAPGRYHLVITPPGQYTVPSTASPTAIAKLPNTVGGYIISDASYEKPFDLTDPAPLEVDVPMDAARDGQLLLEKTASLDVASPGDFVQYRLNITNKSSADASGVTITDTLPIGLRYRAGSTRGVSGNSVSSAVTQPDVSGDGRRLTFTVPTLAAGASTQLSYVVAIAPGAPVGEAINHAVAAGASITSNDASASVRIRPLLFTDALTIIGRVTEGDCGSPERGRKGVPGIRLLMEDGTIVVTDRDGLYHFEGAKPGTHVVQIDTNSVSRAFAPVACDLDSRQARSPISRFVEGGGGSLQRVDFQLRRTGAESEANSALPIDVASDGDAAGNREDWLAIATPGVDWMFPLADHNPRAPALRVVIKHLPGQRVALTVNGAPVDPLSFDGTDSDDKRGVAVSRWTGLPMQDRDNVLEARVLDASGRLVTTLTRTVHYANAAAHVSYVPEKSKLVADGLTRPLIAVRVTDRDGKPVRAGTIIPFRVDQPYTAAQEVAAQQGRQLAGLDRAAATARVVGDDGLAFVALEPTMQAGEVHVVVSLRDGDKETNTDFKAWLAAMQKDWVVVGFGKGTAGYSMLKKHSESVPGGRHDVTTDGQLAFYAKGRIKGSWLITIAYDSAKTRDLDRGLLGQIDPDRYYTVYGDGTQQSYDASTSRKLYLRLERRDFYALFGDFETGMTETKLARYSRTLNGVKAQYQGNHLMFTAFAANDDQLYGRDEIRGNGLSGPYRLSASGIVVNSDQVTIETRDRFRSEKIVDSKQMTRHIDYDIDPDAGTLRFREPILSRDTDLNPIYIVVDYETYGRSRKLAAGGRAAVKLFHGRVEAGASVLRDETLSKATVAGVDLKIHVDSKTEIRAEGATGGRDGLGNGKAYLAEFEHHDSRIDMLAYSQQQDEDFGLGQQNFGEAGTSKSGIDGRLRITEKLNFVGSGWYQRDLDGSAKRFALDTKLEYRRKTGTVFAGAQIASDRTIGDAKRDSRLLTFGGSQNFFNNKVVVTGQTQIAIGGMDSSVDFPVRHQVDVAWRITKGIRLIGTEEIAEGDKYKAHSTRIGFDVAPWTGARLLSTLNQQAIGENGPRTFAQYGLSQSLPLGHGWSVDGTVDASSTVKGTIAPTDLVNPFQPVSSGTTISGTDQEDGDYKAITGGLTYRSEAWSWNGRAEYRLSDLSKRWGFTSNMLRTLGQGKTLASSVRIYKVKEDDGGKVSFASADLAFAMRPLDSRWSLLERLELRHEGANGSATSNNALAVPTFAQGDDTTTRIINNIAVNYRTGAEGDGHGLEVSLYYGAKYVRGRYSDDVYQGFIDVIGLEIRKDVGTHFDVGVAGSVQHAWTDKAVSFSAGPSIGVSPGRNMWITAGYNVTGYRDHDYQDARYTRQGPYVTMRLKFDQLSLGDAGRALRGAVR